MPESLALTPNLPRAERYRELLPQLRAMLEGETDTIANLANTAAALRQAFGFFWVGFYLVGPQEQGGNQLVLGPFQGPIACTRIAKGKGVCGTAWEQQQTLIVPDVNAFPGHIACASESKSEIVVPMSNDDGSVWGVLDVDSDQLDDFSEVDRDALEQLVTWLIPSST
ncbi:MAG: GAF domain-containing protein [Phycisphaerales bacterium JB063]